MAATARLEVRVRPESKAKIALAEIGVSSEFDEPPPGQQEEVAFERRGRAHQALPAALDAGVWLVRLVPGHGAVQR